MKNIFNGLLIVAIIALTFLCIRSILTPINFEKEREKREKVVIQNLVDIRKAQVEYRKQNQRYTSSLDTLVQFLKDGKMAVILKEGTLTDEQLESGLTEVEAVKQGLIRRDTSYVVVKDELFGANYDADNMAYVPFGDGEKFEMASGTITSPSGIVLQVFEAKTLYSVYLHDLDKQELINLNDKARKLERYPGLQVGSILEANNNAGNWE